MCEWLITNKNQTEITGLELISKNKQFKLYYKGEGIYSFNIDGAKVSIIIDGYVLPCIDHASEFFRYKPGSLIKQLYKKYRLEFINYIKSNFVIIIIKSDEFFIFNDRIGSRKIF